jgi:flavin-binding protein dodecin
VSAKTNQNEKTSRDEASFKKDLERQLRAQLAAVTGGLAPEDYAQARWDWYFNLTKQPDKQLALVQSAFEKAPDTWQFAARAATGASMPPEQQARPIDAEGAIAKSELGDAPGRDLRVAEVSELDIQLKDGKVEAYRAKVKVSFKYEGDS